MLKVVLVGAWITAWSAGHALEGATNPSTTVTIDAQANVHAISPLIYGVSGINYGIAANTAQLSDLKAPVVRLGGDETSRYNWQLNADNRANDYYYESIADASSVAGERGDTFIGNAQAAGTAPMVTIPMQSYIANLGTNRSTIWSFSIAKYGAQTGSDPYNPDAGNGISSANGSFITNQPADANVPNTTSIQQAWIQHIVSKWGTAANGGLTYYIMDNEPGFWDSTQRDVHPVGTHASEYLNDFLTYSGLVKGVDPTALVVGPEECDWYTYFYTGYDLQYAAANNYNGVYPDRQNVQGGLDYVPWLLQQIAAHDKTAGSRSLDVFSVHYYPEGPEYSDDTSQSTQLLRNQSTRELWDPSYQSKNVPVLSTGNPGAVVQLIPQLKTWVNTYYPGTTIGITEYSWGADDYIGGATAQADILGIFGREGLGLATRWTQPAPGTPTYLAFKMYRNYDGNGSSYGDTSVSDAVVNPDNLSSFAATRTSDGALTIIVDNKVLTGATPVTIGLNNFSAGASAQVWQLTSANAISQLASVPVNANSLSTTVPAQSITLFIIPPQGPLPQTINFPSIGTQTFGAAPVVLSATASSGLTVSYSVVSGPATVSGNTLTLTGAGTVQVQASQAGNANYAAAANVMQSFTVNQASQTITFNPIGNPVYPGPTITLGATASSGLTVSYSVISGPATVSGSTVTLTGTGMVFIQASQAGNANYLAAANVTQSFEVNAAPATMTFAQWEAQYFNSTQMANSGISGATATPLNDGVPNLLKYVFDIQPTAPMSATDRGALPTVGIDTIGLTTYLTITYREYAGLAAGVTVHVQTSPDLQTWTTVTPDLAPQTVLADGDLMIEAEVNTKGATKEFIRLNITQQ